MTRHTAQPVDPLISLKEGGDILGVHPRTIERAAARGEIRIIRISPRRIGIRRSELERYITAREAAA